MADTKKREPSSAPERLRLAAMGLEAECSLVVDDEPTRPEDLFGSPRDFIRGELMHRQGTSYHLPTGGAVYFDTGVIEVATPVIELERGCAARAGRSLWEALQFIRGELDAWDARNGRTTRLVGFSAHYNVSFELPKGEANGRSIEQLALLLTYILPAPVMLLAANRRSTGVGVRPRTDRIEITCDFTPSPSLMVATAALIVGVVREVMTWPSYDLGELAKHEIPVIRGFHPCRTPRARAGSRASAAIRTTRSPATSTRTRGPPSATAHSACARSPGTRCGISGGRSAASPIRSPCA
jgi:hypothetical protein